MHAIYLLLNLCFNSNIKFNFELYRNYIKIVYTIYYIYYINNMIICC